MNNKFNTFLVITLLAALVGIVGNICICNHLILNHLENHMADISRGERNEG